MRITLPAPKPCRECGSESLWHGQEYAVNLLGVLLRPVLLGAHALGGLLVPAPRPRPANARGLHERLARMGLAEYLDEPDQKTLLLNHVLWQEARARGIALREWRLLGIPTHTFVADLPVGRLVFDSTPPLGGQPAWWIDDKATLKKKLGRLGIPVPEGGAAWSLRGALRIYERVGASVVVKPHEGSATRHTTMRVRSAMELARAFRVARRMSPKVIVERELAGGVYRPTLVRGRVVATLRRDPPTVIGDGTSTIEALVARENAHPARQGPYYSRIALGEDAERELARQGLARQSVLAAGRAATLHQKINWSVGGTTTDVTDEVHPDNIELFERVAAAVQAPLVGIDFITTDIARSWREVPCGVIECNSRPFFDNHHLPFAGKPRNVAGRIWECALATRVPSSS